MISFERHTWPLDTPEQTEKNKKIYSSYQSKVAREFAQDLTFPDKKINHDTVFFMSDIYAKSIVAAYGLLEGVRESKSEQILFGHCTSTQTILPNSRGTLLFRPQSTVIDFWSRVKISEDQKVYPRPSLNRELLQTDVEQLQAFYKEHQDVDQFRQQQKEAQRLWDTETIKYTVIALFTLGIGAKKDPISLFKDSKPLVQSAIVSYLQNYHPEHPATLLAELQSPSRSSMRGLPQYKNELQEKLRKRSIFSE